MAQRWQQNYELYRKYLEATVNIYKSRKDIQMFSELLLSLGAIIIFGIFAIRPTLVTIAGLSKEINEKRRTIIQLDNKIESLVAAQTNYEQNKIAIDLLDFAIPTNSYPQVFLRQVEGVAQKDTVSLASVNINDIPIKGRTNQTVKNLKKSEEKTYNISSASVPITISAAGNYNSILAFTSDLENLRRLILPERVELFTREETGSNIVYINLNGRIIFREGQQ